MEGCIVKHNDDLYLSIGEKDDNNRLNVVTLLEQPLQDAVFIENKKLYADVHSINTLDISAITLVEPVEQKYLDVILRRITANMAKYHYNATHKKKAEQKYTEGGRIGYAGRVFDSDEITALVDSSLDFWLTSGKYTEKFEKELAKFLDVKYVSFVNSGSSANLVAFMTLTSPKLGDRQIRRGDEVITVAAGFPTTMSPIVQYGAIPVFVDINIPTYNIDISELEEAYSKKTKAVMLAHTLGNCFNLTAVKEFCERHNLWLIEDNCDALGARYNIGGKWKFSGTIGDIGTSSFYPAHHITTGEGGAVYTNNLQLKQIADSFRDWGRDCYCNSGRDNSCGKRFQQQFGEMPAGYDHKYIYSHFGYNLKASDMQAAVGGEQLRKLPTFVEARKKNWKALRDGLESCSSHLILPEAEPNSDPSWFAFVITLKDGINFDRDEIVNHLEQNGVQTRNVFAGNVIKQPCFDDMRKSDSGFRVVGDLTNTDKVMTDTFFIGVYPGLTNEMLAYMIKTIKEFVQSK